MLCDTQCEAVTGALWPPISWLQPSAGVPFPWHFTSADASPPPPKMLFNIVPVRGKDSGFLLFLANLWRFIDTFYLFMLNNWHMYILVYCQAPASTQAQARIDEIRDVPQFKFPHNFISNSSQIHSESSIKCISCALVHIISISSYMAKIKSVTLFYSHFYQDRKIIGANFPRRLSWLNFNKIRKIYKIVGLGPGGL